MALDPARLLAALLKREDATADTTDTAHSGESIPAGVSIRAQPVLTEAESVFYNLLRLTVQDQYLLCAQVPVWCLVEVAGDRRARAAMLDRIALKRVDFALVHPGTLVPAKVVELDDPADVSDRKQARDRLLDTVFAAANVEVVRLDVQRRYTVPQLSELLGMAPQD